MYLKILNIIVMFDDDFHFLLQVLSYLCCSHNNPEHNSNLEFY